MSTLLKPFLVQEKLLEHKLQVFTPLEFERLFNTTTYQTKYFMEPYTKQGFLVRFKRGLYGLKTHALVDYVYLVSLGQKTLNERLMVKGSDPQKAYAYARLFKHPAEINVTREYCQHMFLRAGFHLLLKNFPRLLKQEVSRAIGN